MANQGIHGSLLELTVVGCNKLKDTEWISRQDPYVCIEYASNRNRTGVCTDGGKNPTFQDRFVYSLIEGLRELNVIVWNSNTLSHDDFIGSEKVQLAKVLSQGFDDSYWPLQTKTGRHAGEVRLIMHYSKANANNVNNYAAGAHPTSYGTSIAPYVSMYSAPPPPPPLSSMYYPPAATGAHPTSFSYSSNSYSYPPTTNLGVYPPSPYPPNSGVYPQPPYPYPYPYPHQAAPYPPQSHPLNSDHPLLPYGSHYPHGSQYPGPGVYPSAY